MRYLGRIKGAEALANSLKFLATNWHRRDHAALEAWLEANPQFSKP